MAESLQEPQTTWAEHWKALSHEMFSPRRFLAMWAINLAIALSLGIVFQTLFLFTLFRGLVALSYINRPAHAFLIKLMSIKNVASTLPTPPRSAYISSAVGLLIAGFFAWVGYYAYTITGFCRQSIGCIFGLVVQQLLHGR